MKRFQQTTGPMQAKGLEDTAFYRQYPLVSINEVGADPSRFGISPSAFHAMNADRLAHWPGSLGTTATHDTKRGEDARIRIDALSEFPERWKAHLARWQRINARKKVEVRGAPAPDAREEYLLYQALVGGWPIGGPDDASPEGFSDRVSGFFLKAVREAKLNTSWSDPEPDYVQALDAFVKAILDGPDASVFIRDFLSFQRAVGRVGMVHSLAQTLLKIASPGVPDVYQGCELWDFSFVDPDNRRPVDFEGRRRLLEGLDDAIRAGKPRAEIARALFAAPEDGAIKLLVVATALRHRHDNQALYLLGNYRPLDVEGEHRTRVVAFGRHREGKAVIVASPRLVAPLMGDDALAMPLGREVWNDTRLTLPEGPIPRLWRDLLTDRIHEIDESAGAPPSLAVGDLFRDVPLAFLSAE